MFIQQSVQDHINGLLLSTSKGNLSPTDWNSSIHDFVNAFNGTLARAYMHGLHRECCASTLWALQDLLKTQGLSREMSDMIGDVCWNLQLFLGGISEAIEA